VGEVPAILEEVKAAEKGFQAVFSAAFFFGAEPESPEPELSDFDSDLVSDLLSALPSDAASALPSVLESLRPRGSGWLARRSALELDAHRVDNLAQLASTHLADLEGFVRERLHDLLTVGAIDTKVFVRGQGTS
jgi:hypothetical protein